MNQDELLKKVNKLVEEEMSHKPEEMSSDEYMREFLLPALENSKNTLESLYLDRSKKRTGVIGKLKSFIEKKIENIALGVVEKQSTKQAKFNEAVYRILKEISERKES